MPNLENAFYFQQLNKTLKSYHRSIPFLLIDLNRLDQNIAILKKNWRPETAFRIVVKSLPCVELVEYIMERTTTQNLMVFHQPFLSDLASRLGAKVDILLGKPIPVKTANHFYQTLPENDDFDAFRQVQWLVDTAERIHQYLALAKQLGRPLRLNLEIDVGLHRGGFQTVAELSAALQVIQTNDKHLIFTGLMGYDPHVAKLPKVIRSPQKALQLANDFYFSCQQLIREQFPDLWSDDLTFNGAGSPTLEFHKNDYSPLNDIAAGSCLVKPTTFDIPTLSEYQPACFIATPVLKKFNNTTLPALEKMKKVLNLIDAANRQSYFIYGGFWKADYCFPKGIKQNNLFGASTNQTMLNISISTQLEVDDFIFLRPHQSEFVFLQFGRPLAIRNGEVVAEWTILNQNQ
ncbi:MAG: alanine racemase [Bacteroidota bacterium]